MPTNDDIYRQGEETQRDGQLPPLYCHHCRHWSSSGAHFAATIIERERERKTLSDPFVVQVILSEKSLLEAHIHSHSITDHTHILSPIANPFSFFFSPVSSKLHFAYFLSSAATLLSYSPLCRSLKRGRQKAVVVSFPPLLSIRSRYRWPMRAATATSSV